MMKPQIWFDFDDTLCDWHKVIIPFHNKLFNASLTRENYQHHDYFKLYHVEDKSWEWLREQWRVHRCGERVELFDGVPDMMMLLSEHFSLNIVTARGWHPHAADITRETLEHAGVTVDHVIAIHYGMDKGQVLQEHGSNVIAFVEDTVKHCDNVHKAGIPLNHIYLIDAPWNKENTSYHRLSHVTELSSILLPTQPSFAF